MKRYILIIAFLFCFLITGTVQANAITNSTTWSQSIPNTSTNFDNRKTFYAIAHHVITTKGVSAAAKHGANAIEVDASAWPSQGGWLADHDHMTLLQAGDKIEDIFKAVTEANKDGGKIRFVWLDIKTPTYVKDQSNPASLKGLQKVAQRLLEEQNVYVQFGFTSKDAQGSEIIHNLMNNLYPKEAVDLWGDTDKALSIFEKYAPNLPSKQRSIDNGLFYIPLGFNYRLNQLKQADKAVNDGKISRTYSWTITSGQDKYVNSLLDNAHVNGIIYGSPALRYKDTQSNIKALDSITNAVKEHPQTYRMATVNDNPW